MRNIPKLRFSSKSKVSRHSVWTLSILLVVSTLFGQSPSALATQATSKSVLAPAFAKRKPIVKEVVPSQGLPSTKITAMDGPKPQIPSAPVPQVQGTRKVGSTLSVLPGSWTQGTNLEFRWFRDGLLVPEWSENSITLTGRDFAKSISVAVIGTNPAYEQTTRLSFPTTKIAADSYEPPVALSFASELSTGYGFSCAVQLQGSVQCVGNNTYGSLGNGNFNSSERAIEVSGLDNALSVSSTYYHSCALTDNGEVACWGNNADGQLGNNTRGNVSASFVTVEGISSAVEVEVGNYHSCALLVDGTVKCWGNNFQGQLGNGTNTSASMPVSVQGLKNVVGISVGGNHSCALLTNGSVSCWGEYTFWQSGALQFTFGDSLVPAQMPLVNSVRSISSGEAASCAILDNGSIRCWGQNYTSTAAVPESTGSYSFAGTTTIQNTGGYVADVNGISSATNISSGSASCAVLTDFTIRCWGDTRTLQVDDFQFVSVTSGPEYRCAITYFGEVYCWGQNGSGQLGNSTTESCFSVISWPDGDSDCRLVVASEFGGRFIRSPQIEVTGNLTVGSTLTASSGEWDEGTSISYSWLRDGVEISPEAKGSSYVLSPQDFGKVISVRGIASKPGFLSQVRHGVTNAHIKAGTYEVPDSFGMVSSISSGTGHSCAVLLQGTLKCWGSNSFGQLGDGSRVDSLTSRSVTNLSNVKQVSAGSKHTCALTFAGSVMCWGLNSNGQLGNGSLVDSARPVSVAGISNAISVETGSNFTCALLMTGQTFCWGANDSWQLGQNRNSNSMLAPAQTKPGPPAIQLDVGGLHACVLLLDTSAACWGNNAYGQLGDGETTWWPVPQRVENHSGFKTLAAGENHTCAVSLERTVWCWGSNGEGQLGNGTTSDSSSPIQVPSLGPSSQLSAGALSTCSAGSDGQIACWGNNSYGRLGDGGFLNSPLPAFVAGIEDGLVVSTRGDFACALVSNLSVRCWGNNSTGQLGNNTRALSRTPTSTSPIIIGAALIPAVSVAERITGGYAFNILNFDSNYQFKVNLISGNGQIKVGIPTGTRLPVTVTAVAPGQVVVIKIVSSRADYSDGSILVSGSSLSVFSSVPAPIISGNIKIGGVLKVSVAHSKPTETKYVYSWYRSGYSKAIGSGSFYKITTADRGRTITVKVTAYRDGFVPKIASSRPTKRL